MSTSRTAPKKVKESKVVLFGSKNDPEVQASINKVAITGRKTELQRRPSFDTGLGKCGKHLCHCKEVCSNSFNGKAFEGDNAPMMGHSF